MLSVRDPIHGFIRADPLEAALVDTRPLQRLRSVRQLGLTSLVFPGAEHSRFSHALGAMHLAGRIYDALATHAEGLLEPGPSSRQRRLVRAAALLHDIGHAPYSHSAEELFEGGIDHEEMSRRLLTIPELEEIFSVHGEGLEPADVSRLLEGGASGPDADPSERLLSQIVASELDVDKMDYLLRDSLFCGVRYGSYDLDRLVDTVRPIYDPERSIWGIGVAEAGVHALEALVMARYYMFTQVYFNPSVQALELHMGRWLEETGHRWPGDPMTFLDEDDLTTFTSMRRSENHHAGAVVQRRAFPPRLRDSRASISRREIGILGPHSWPARSFWIGQHPRVPFLEDRPPFRLGAGSRTAIRRRGPGNGAGQSFHSPSPPHRSISHLFQAGHSRRGQGSASELLRRPWCCLVQASA